MSKPKRKIKLNYSKYSDSMILEQLNKIPNNELLSRLETMNKTSLEKSDKLNILFPHLDDPDFNAKLVNKKEFNDLKTDTNVYDVEERSNQLCGEKKHFELLPHQQFVKNFLSSQTPYNGLLLFHGLGTGKTCSGISIAEEMRNYLKQMGINKRIIIVASPNVQENFKLQLFDKRNLTNINGIWNLENCTGNKFLKEINPMNMKGLNKENIEKLVKRIINKNYLFMGSEQFSNYIYRTITREGDAGKKRVDMSEADQEKAIKREFSNRLVIIDEIHNIKTVKDIPEKKTTQNILKLVTHADNLKMLLLSATPMFNTPEEIVWLLNVLNKNDNRSTINPSQVFDKDGNLIVKSGVEVGKNILIQKARGYISYVRGDNPYTYPFRIYPKMFLTENTMDTYVTPTTQLNGNTIIQGIEFLDIFVNTMQEYQQNVYDYIVSENLPVIERSKGGLGYHLLGSPLQSLNIVYPSEKFDSTGAVDYNTLIGKKGLSRIVKFSRNKTKYEYKPGIVSKYGRIFDMSNIGLYSHKIHKIVESTINCDGIVLIYSQYIEGGCVPIALALEEAGFNRVGRDNLFSESSKESIGNYSMITGDIHLSPNNLHEIKIATNNDNMDGGKIKVIIISEAGSEGIDLKNIRQVHIMEPWYNMSRIEQIFGRAVRNCSHKLLPFNKRNVQLFLYGTILSDETKEAADMYVYRLAERKSVKIGNITRILKENAVDCSLNKNVLSESKMSSKQEITLGNKQVIEYLVGDKPFTSVCDYMDTCEYECNITPMTYEPSLYTYNEYYININVDNIILKIKDLYKFGYLYDKMDIIKNINQTIIYPIVQINSALDKIVNDSSIIFFDLLERPGNLVNVGKFYIYQPLGFNNKLVSMFDREHPNSFKHEKIRIVLPENIVRVEEYGESIFKTLKHKFKYRNTTTIITKGTEEIDWYKAAGNAINKSDVPEFNKNSLRLIHILKKEITDEIKIHFYISHMIDVLSIENKKNLLEYLFKYMKEKVTTPETLLFRDSLFEHFRKMMIEDSDRIFIVFGSFETGKLEYYEIIDEKLQQAKPVDMKRILKAKKKLYSKLDFSQYIGLMVPFKKSYSVFKIRDTKKKRDTGYRCDQKGKIDILRVLNSTLDEGVKSKKEYFTYENTNLIENAREMCVDQELLFRFYNYKNTQKKTWFLSLEDYLFTKLI